MTPTSTPNILHIWRTSGSCANIAVRYSRIDPVVSTRNTNLDTTILLL